MQFSRIHTDKDFLRRLRDIVDEGRIGHSYMFHEDAGGGGLAAAIAFIQYILCENRENGDSCGVCPSCNKVQKLIHPDIHFAFPVANPPKAKSGHSYISKDFIPQWREALLDNPYFGEQEINGRLGIAEKVGLIKVDEAKDILDKLALLSYEGREKFMVIWLPERMNAEAANKLLKIVEEPFPGTIFLFISQNPDKVIKTIQSRCIRLRIKPMNPEDIIKALIGEYTLNEDDVRLYSHKAFGSYGEAVKQIKSAGKRDEDPDTEYREILTAMLNNTINRRLSGMYPLYNRLNDLGREGQRRFCIYAEEFIRKIFIAISKVDEINYNTAEEAALISGYSARLSSKFCMKSFSALDYALKMIESNVNSKVVFSNLGNRFFVSL